jgi:hypothetical protein
MTRCRSHKEASDSCKVIANIHAKCFAIAVQQDDNGYGWNTAATVPEAEKRAMERCEGYGKSCAVRSSFCDTGTTTTTYSGSLPPIAAPVPAPPPKPAAHTGASVKRCAIGEHGRRIAGLPEISRSLLARMILKSVERFSEKIMRKR